MKLINYFNLTTLLLACVLFSSCNLITDGVNYTDLNKPRYYHRNVNNGPASFKDTLKVVSYNIKFAQKAEEAGELLKSQEELVDADIIFLQEMDAQGVEAIAKKLNYNYVYYPAVRHPLYNRDFGNAILTKWPILHDQKIILPHLDTNKLQRIAVGAMIKIGNKSVMAYSVHMRVFLHPFQRKNQMARLINSIPPHTDYVIVGGDFNTFTKFNRTVIFNSFEKAQFKHATTDIDWTYKHWYLFNRKSLLDYIFVRGLDVIDAGKIKKRRASDHIPIWAKLKFSGTKIVLTPRLEASDLP